MKLAKRFYVGSTLIMQPGNPHVKATLAEAIEAARAACELSDQEQIVVQIVRVVRRRQQPIVVEVVK